MTCERSWREECGIVGIADVNGSAEMASLALHALQHRGQESAGISVADGHSIRTRKGMGLVADVFDAHTIQYLTGNSAIGHVRYSTAGSSHVRNAQPIQVASHHGSFAMAHNGNLINAPSLRRSLEETGSIFSTTSDSEVILHLVARSQAAGMAEALLEVLPSVQGAYSLLVLTRDSLIAVRDPHGFRPLCLGRFQDRFIVASETCALDIIGATWLRDIEPGEMVIIKGGELVSRRLNGEDVPTRSCIFEHVYFSRPDSIVFGRSVDKVRRQCGHILAQESPVEADLVCAVPDSSNTAALGFARETMIPFELALIRNHYVGRTFISPAQKIRDMSCRIKFNPVAEVMKDKRVILVDDSIVRGTTMRKLVKVIRAAGASEVHLRIASPPITHPCYYGIDTPVRKELIASSHTVEEIATYLRVDSLEYLSLEGLLRAADDNGDFCRACFTGDYPLSFTDAATKDVFDTDIDEQVVSHQRLSTDMS